jgi:prepilin-type N-terminal cleavage/methylation domain-containing protein
VRKPNWINDMKLAARLPEDNDVRRPRRKGFTMLESMIVVVVLGTMFSIGLPKMSEGMRQRRVIAASSALHADIPVAFSLAARQRKPVTLTYDAASGEIRVSDRAEPDTIYLRRALRASSEYMLDSVSMTPSSVQLFPNGVSSSAFTIRLANGKFVRQVTVGRTGFSRVTVN